MTNVTNQAAGTPIGKNDKHGKPIHIGDTMSFDPKEFGAECIFVVEMIDGEVTHPGTAHDLGEWCEIVKPWSEVERYTRCTCTFKDAVCGYTGPGTYCDKSIQSCRDKFNNFSRFCGYPISR